MSVQDSPTLDRSVIATFRDGLPDGATDILPMLIDQFLEEAASQAGQLRDAGRRGDAAALKSAAHNLKGSSTTMGAKRLGALCHAVEAYAAAQAVSVPVSPGAMADLMNALDRELTDVRQALLAERDGVSRT